MQFISNKYVPNLLPE